jgi:hypothetical protein
MFSTVLIAGATVVGIKEMETVAFCGTVCHTVMQPEHTAFQRSPHSKITCADCHIGAGADWFVKSKISGSWQLVSVALNLYPRPVTSPVHNLRPARETCEQCHWPTKHVGDQLQVKTKFADDEKNSETKTVLLVKVGGQQGSASTGIHWHVDRGVEIRYLSDPSRQKIYDIEMTVNGKKRVYKTDDKPEGATEWRSMDCVDCHNRPSHTFYPPDTEMDRAMEDGRIDKTLPFVKKEGMRLLTEGQYASHEEARAGIEASTPSATRAAIRMVLVFIVSPLSGKGHLLMVLRISGSASSSASTTWQVLQLRLILAPSSAVCFLSWQRKQPGASSLWPRLFL